MITDLANTIQRKSNRQSSKGHLEERERLSEMLHNLPKKRKSSNLVDSAPHDLNQNEMAPPEIVKRRKKES
jgi:hypothetical protein